MPITNTKQAFPVTPAIRMLRAAGAEYTGHLYVYVEKGGTARIASELHVDEHIVIKTLIMETGEGRPLVVLMHGDRSVSTKELARAIGVKSVAPCKPEQADRNSGYKCGGTSPFATRKRMPVYVERSILALDRIFINGGHQGFALEMKPDVLVKLLSPIPVDVAIEP